MRSIWFHKELIISEYVIGVGGGGGGAQFKSGKNAPTLTSTKCSVHLWSVKQMVVCPVDVLLLSPPPLNLHKSSHLRGKLRDPEQLRLRSRSH